MKKLYYFRDFTSERYRDIPEQFKFNELIFPSRCVLLTQYKDELTELADRYYRNHEIVGDTYVDFFEDLQLKLDMRADSLERILVAYSQDLDNFNIGNKSVTEYDVHHDSENEGKTGSEFVDVPIDDSAHDKPTTRDRSDSESTGTSHQTGSVTVTADNTTGQSRFDLLNRFIDKHRSVHELFIDTFQPCFTVREVLTW